ncbi:MAG: ATP-dependent DNA helicase [Candidatus Marinimicrobia bacterium]|nr:ATP-dependent DNA helicase [Candidatus Neomarinimicrobiota bacterium]
MENFNLYGIKSPEWKKIFSKFDTLFVLKTGSGDELAWIKDVVLDPDANVNVIDLELLVQFFLPGLKDKSFLGLYKKFLNKKFRSHPGLMEETLIMGVNILREIVYLFSKNDTLLHTHLLDITNSLRSLAELNSIYELITNCKEMGWLSDDLLAQPNPEHDDFEIMDINGWQLLKNILPVENKNEIVGHTTVDDSIPLALDSAKHFFDSAFIKNKLSSYEKRDAQIDYAVEVGKSLNGTMHNYVEAPTGIGKSLGYLVPSALYIEKNPLQKVIIATATKNLQNQLIEKDWPLIKERFPDLKITSLKGKSNYVCISALARQYSHYFDHGATTKEKASWLAMALFILDTEGDVENISYKLKKWLDPIKDLINDIRADLHCNISLCKPTGCVYGHHISSANRANIIITNHFKAVMMNEDILGSARIMIIDEAEQFGDNVRQALSTQIDSRDINRLFIRLKGIGKRRGFSQIIEEKINSLAKKKSKKGIAAKAAIDKAKNFSASVKYVDLVIDQFIRELYPNNGKIPPLMQQFPVLRHSKDSLSMLLQPVISAFGQLNEALKEMQDEVIPISKQMKERCESYRVLVEELYGKFAEFSKGFMSRYYAHHFKGTPDSNWTLVKLPVTIYLQLNDSIYKFIDHVFFTSATLYTEDTPLHFISEYGSHDANEEAIYKRFPTIFKYDHNTICAVDTSITPYNFKDHDQMNDYRNDVDRAICSYTLAANGRTLILFMSQQELDRSYERTSGFFFDHDILPIRQNGSSLAEIREFDRNEYSVLFGVGRFWTGVDFPGSTLSQVIITKAPNPGLNNPLIAHQRHWDPSFFDNIYPIYGKMKLRQGFGRLIRSMNDKGGVIILDSRYLFSPWLYVHLDELPVQISFIDDQEKIMRKVLKKAGLNKEFHERRIDPFLETDQFDLLAKKTAVHNDTIKLKKAV